MEAGLPCEVCGQGELRDDAGYLVCESCGTQSQARGAAASPRTRTPAQHPPPQAVVMEDVEIEFGTSLRNKTKERARRPPKRLAEEGPSTWDAWRCYVACLQALLRAQVAALSVRFGTDGLDAAARQVWRVRLINAHLLDEAAVTA